MASLKEKIIEFTVSEPKKVILIFGVVTLLLAPGALGLKMESGMGQYAEGIDEYQTWISVNNKFSMDTRTQTEVTQLIQTGNNVLSKKSLLNILEVQEKIKERETLKADSTSSAASFIAKTIDPTAETIEEQINAIKGSSSTKIKEAIKKAAEFEGFRSMLSRDFSKKEASATATIATIGHNFPREEPSLSGGSRPTLTDIQTKIKTITQTSEGNIQVFGTGIISEEFNTIIIDTLKIVVPAAILFTLFFLILAYRDPIDLFLSLACLSLILIWTFGVLGWLNISFTQMLITVPVLLVAVGIDFGIHVTNRYREEDPCEKIQESMRTTLNQLIIAFFLVTSTTIIGFIANLISPVGPIKDFGLAAGIGVIFTFFIFGILFPALKICLDNIRKKRNIPRFCVKPLGTEQSYLGKTLIFGEKLTTKFPIIFLIILLLSSAYLGYQSKDMKGTFEQEDFLPPENLPKYVDYLPEFLKPNEYTITKITNFLEQKFQSATDQITIIVHGNLERNYALEMIDRTNQNPPESFVKIDNKAETQSILTLIETAKEKSPKINQLIEKNDPDNDGIPERDLETIYDTLLTSRFEDQTKRYLTETRRHTQIIYTVKEDVSNTKVREDAKKLAQNYRYNADSTGSIIVTQAVSDLIINSAIKSLILALTLAGLFLIIAYKFIEKNLAMGIINLIPIAIAVAFVVGTMKAINMSFNPATATILSLTIGLGVDYTVHTTHRFIDEYKKDQNIKKSTRKMLMGTGGALTGSMLTTTLGIGTLILSITPVLKDFGIIMAISIFYCYLSSILVLPTTIAVWEKITKK
ncbi:MAG: putative exporter of the RND superfamily [Candidatus Methanohalarchaeum thermophilum]|uniref:Exporter of the RND superfamily n=1 Tax=Methanohalarchaeum thermophilum TaxID=1903181 RepID=A0A1Q6DWM9_METT1|nr:MAG: putative exporter of the RND superfamily [Candidatus Methanohalarchaeum thermophilum]